MSAATAARSYAILAFADPQSFVDCAAAGEIRTSSPGSSSSRTTPGGSSTASRGNR
jgi:hypothetical protein